VILYIWPESYRVAGWAALAAGLLGFALPFLLHGQLHTHEERAMPGLLWLAFLALALHALLDGVALFSPETEPMSGHSQEQGILLGAAVVLHRVPTALAIWWLVVPRLGKRPAVALLSIVGLATVLGFALAGPFLGLLSAPGVAAFQAGIAGMLMHIVLGHEHPHAKQAPAKVSRRTSAAGALLGIALLVVVNKVHPMGHPGTGEHAAAPTFQEMLRLVTPAIALGALIWFVRARRAHH